MKERLQKLMARAGLGSRRSNEAMIAAGRVRLNGRVAHLGDKADPQIDQVTVDGIPLNYEAKVYIMLNKPKGVLSSTEDELEQGRTTVTDLVNVSAHIYPVGRLDKQSEGLILLTNDGELAHRLTHPRYEHEKVYDVVLIGQPSSAELAEWSSGVMLDGRQTAPATVQLSGHSGKTSRLLITLREGRKRQIRRVANLMGYEVQSLVRRQIGPLELLDLPSGEWRYLSIQEVASLREAAGL